MKQQVGCAEWYMMECFHIQRRKRSRLRALQCSRGCTEHCKEPKLLIYRASRNQIAVAGLRTNTGKPPCFFVIYVAMYSSAFNDWKKQNKTQFMWNWQFYTLSVQHRYGITHYCCIIASLALVDGHSVYLAVVRSAIWQRWLPQRCLALTATGGSVLWTYHWEDVVFCRS